MIKVNISHSPLSVTLIDGNSVVDHYSGKVEDIITKLATDAYNVGLRDGNDIPEEKSVWSELDKIQDSIKMTDEGSPDASD